MAKALAVVSCFLALRSAAAFKLGHKGAKGPAPYYWPRARGHVGSYSVTELHGPANLSAAFSWSWHHPDGRYSTVVVSGPLIDDEKNIYLASEDGVRKFNEDGQPLWHYKARGPGVVCPSLMDGALFSNTQNGWVFALDMATGNELWAERKAESVGGDTAYVEAYDGVIVTGVDSGKGGGNMRLLGIDAASGKTLWEYRPSDVLWNVMAVFTGDDSLIVMNVHGGVYKHALHNATLHWEARPPAISSFTFSDGGVMLGPDGTAYTCSNLVGTGNPGEYGALRAYALKDGRMLWDRHLDYPCNSWPVVTADGRSVIVPTGAFVGSPAAGNTGLMIKSQRWPEQMHELSLSLGAEELKTYGLPERTAAVVAFDTLTGEPHWRTELPPYGRLAARGDEEGYLIRKTLGHRDQCLPAQFSSPTVSADGTVYVGRADGKLYAVESGTGRWADFQTDAGFLHPGTSWAPGMMAVASCDGLFVWKY